MNPKICAYFGYDNNVVNDFLRVREEEEPELKFINDCENHRYIHKMTDEDKEKFDLGYKVLREKRKDLDIDYSSYSRNKITVDGQERKLFRYLKDSALSEEVGKYKLPNRDLYFVLSTNPDDFVLCSTNNKSWTSCTDLLNGDFKYTAMGNIFTGGRFIMYITDLTEKEFLDAKSYDMIFRAFGFIGNDDKLYSNIWYPMRANMDIDIGDIHINHVKGQVRSKYLITKIFNKFGSFTSPYMDFGQVFNDNDYDISLDFLVDENYHHFYPKTYFANNKEMKTSAYYWYDGCNINTSIKRRCDKCGTNIGYIETHGKLNYCEECMKEVTEVCCVCGKRKHNCHYTEDNKWMCDDCVKENNIRLCSNCGTTIRMKNKNECKYCRSTKIDPFKNIQYEYFDKKAGNVRDYFRHCYVEPGDVPPGLIDDEDFFEEHEIYLKR